MKARVKWVEDVQFVGESGTKHSLIMDGPENLGGHGTGMRPMELLLLGLGGCTSFDVVEMLSSSWIKEEREMKIKHVVENMKIANTVGKYRQGKFPSALRNFVAITTLMYPLSSAQLHTRAF